MKTRLSIGRSFAIAISSLLLSPTSVLRSAPSDATEYPYVIAIELGTSEFAPGDSIVIESLRGNRPHLENGGRYLLEGRYTLASAESASLAWFITSRGPSGPSPISAGEHTTASRGSNTFRLTKTFTVDGWPHVSFYVNGPSAGGIYFGEQGVASTVLRRKSGGISDFMGSNNAQPTPQAAKNPERGTSGNRAIMEYLGDPVPLPANLDPRYSADGLKTAFATLAKKNGLEITRVSVDDSEFPCIIHGVISGIHDFREIQNALSNDAGFAYAGSVVGRTGDDATYFSLNMTPYGQYPADLVEAARKRLMIRLQLLADQAKNSR